MSKERNIDNPQSLTSKKLWPVVLSLGREQMKSLFDFLTEHLYPWPEEKLMKVHEEIKKGKVLTEKEFQARFADYISAQK